MQIVVKVEKMPKIINLCHPSSMFIYRKKGTIKDKKVTVIIL